MLYIYLFRLRIFSWFFETFLFLALILQDLKYPPVNLPISQPNPHLLHEPECHHITFDLLILCVARVRIVLCHERIEAYVLILEEEVLSAEVTVALR
jgi:hypothetical protein